MHRLRLVGETITPVHIGNGEKLTPLFDFLCIKGDDGRWYVWKVHIDELIDFAEKHKVEKSLFSAAIERTITLSDFLKDRGLFDEFVKILKYKRKPALAFDEVKTETFEHENVEGRYIIPGSSLKGAIRTALVYHVFKRRKKDFGEINIPNSDWEKKQAFKPYERLIFGSEPKRDALRGLMISDSVKMKRAVFFLKLDRVHLDKGVSEVSTGAEVLDVKNVEFKLNWNFSKNLWKLTDAKFKEELGFLFDGDVQGFCDVINQFSIDFCDYELRRASLFKNYPRELKEFYRNLREEIRALKGKRAFIIRLGRFKTFMNQTIGMLESIVIAKLFGVVEAGRFPRTEWVANYPRSNFKTVPLGWMRFNFEREL